MKTTALIIVFFSCINLVQSVIENNYTNGIHEAKENIPEKNKRIIEYAEKYGPAISPTYEQAVCTEFVIGILEKFIDLTKEDKKRIRIITNEDIYVLRSQHSPIAKGVYYALILSGKGDAVDKPVNVKPGDFVQFWYQNWGHCGIVKSIDLKLNSMELYSSFPSTNGYGMQNFKIPEEAYFVRLK